MQNTKINTKKSKYVMYFGNPDNQMKLVFDSKELYEESLLYMSENHLKNIFERLLNANATKQNVISRKTRLFNMARVMFENNLILLKM